MKTFVLWLLLLLLAGCRGAPTRGEREARRQLQAVAGSYRPHDRKPELPPLSGQSGLSNYLACALLNQPRVEAAYFDWRASVERITLARSLPDPQFTFQMDIQSVVTSVMPGLMGVVPWPGRPRLGAEVASAESAAKRAAFEAAALRSAFDLKRAYYQLHLQTERLRVNRETLALWSQEERLARARNEAGQNTLAEILEIRAEQDRLRAAIANLEDSRAAWMAQFKAALGLQAADPEPPLPERFESTPAGLTPDEWLATALARNQRLKATAADVQAAEAALQLARKDRLPDFSLGLMADVQMQPVLYRPAGTLSLPLWRDKIAARIAEAQAGKRAAEARLTAGEIALAADFAGRAFLYREAERALALLKDQLLPQARQALAVTRAEYLAGQVDFFRLLERTRALLSLELEQAEAATQREIMLAELSLIIQGMPPADRPPEALAASRGPASSASMNTLTPNDL